MFACLLALTSLGLTCGPEPHGDCFGLGNATVEIGLVDAYLESSVYFYPRLGVDPRPSCGGIESFGPAVFFTTQHPLRAGDSRCDVVPAATATVPGADVQWSQFDQYSDVYVRGDTLEQEMSGANIVAQGTAQLADGCLGRYTMLLHNTYTYGPTGFEYEAPVPGERPQWFLTRIFEPGLNCEASFGSTLICSDRWVIQLLEVQPL